MTEEINRKTPVPLYYQVVQILRREIEAGKYQPGEYIPTEMELQQRFNISRATVRQALSDLVYSGLLERRRSKGTVVAKMPIEETLLELGSFTNEMLRRNLVPSARMLDFKVIPAPEQIAAHLGLNKEDAITAMERLRLANGEPVAVERMYIPLAVAPGLKKGMYSETGLEQSTYYILMKQFGINIFRAFDTISSVGVETHDARLLGLEPGVPVLLRTRTSYGLDDRPVCFSSGVFIIKLNMQLEVNRKLAHT